MENVLTVRFADEAIAYKALSEFRANPESYRVLTAGVVVAENGRLETKDGFNFDPSLGDDWATGGLIGALVGILGGPIGVLLGGSLGALTGSLIDLDDAEDQAGVLDQVSGSITQDGTVLILIAQETSSVVDDYLHSLGATDIKRESVAEVEASILQAQQAQRELEKKAREELRQQKRENFKEKAQNRQAEIKEKFSKIFKKNS